MSSINKTKKEDPVITIQKINNVQVKPMKIKNKLDRPAKGHDMFTNPYSNIFILSRKNSGKSVLIANIIKKCCRKDFTTVVVFSNTIHKDPTWIALKKWCKKKGLDFVGHTSIRYTDSNGSKKDALNDLLKKDREVGDEEELDSEESKSEDQSSYSSEEEDESMSEPDEPQHFNFGLRPSKPIKMISERPSTKIEYPTIAPRLFIVFDDISSDLKLPSVQELIKQNRHYESMCCFSSQHIKDLLPSCHQNADAYCLFSGLGEDALAKIKEDASLHVSLNTLMKMYKKSTEKKFSFFYIDVRNDQFRINFDRKFNIITNKDAE